MTYVYLAVLWLICFLSSAQAAQMCSSLDNLKGAKKGKFLPESQILNMTMPGIMICSRACLMRRRCKSFNFNTGTGECQLNSKGTSASTLLKSHSEFVFSDISHWPERLAGVCAGHTCPLNSYCDPVNNTNFVCIITGCLDVPSIVNGHPNEAQFQEENAVGTVLAYTCDQGNVSPGEVICQDNGTWSPQVCVSVSSCSMVKQYQPDSEDGEYWLYLTNSDNYTAKIYCHNMSTSSPQEFLTLPHINYGIYPGFQDSDCDGNSGPLFGTCTGESGEIWFNKIRVNITTMKVVEEDRTFASVTGTDQNLKYGHAFDCYTYHPSNELRCGTKGRFDIDLRGTGWIISEDQQWEAYGWNAMIESIDRQMNGTVINLRCGGYDGGCKPAEGSVLTPFLAGLSNPP